MPFQTYNLNVFFITGQKEGEEDFLNSLGGNGDKICNFSFLSIEPIPHWGGGERDACASRAVVLNRGARVPLGAHKCSRDVTKFLNRCLFSRKL